MNRSKLIEQLKLLSETEMKRFYLFLQGPYFTKSDNVIKLYNFVKEFYPTFEHKSLKKEHIFRKLFPKENYSDIKLRNLQSKLCKIVESYLIQISYEEDAFQKKKKLTQIYETRNYYSEFERNSNQLIKTLQAKNYQDAISYHDRYQLLQAYYLNPNTPKKRDNVNLLINALQNLQNFYAIEELRLGMDLKNRERIFSESYDFRPTPNILISEDNLLYNLLEKSWNLLNNNDDTSYFDLKSIFLNNISHIPPREVMNIFPVLTNYAIQQIGINQEKFFNEIFDLYEIGLDKKLLFINGELSEGTFFNIVTVCANLKKIKFGHQFIQEHEQFLNLKHRASIKALAKGVLFFHEEKYTVAIDALTKFKFSDLLKTLVAKSFLLLTYFQLYEKDPTYYDILQSQCDAFSRFIGKIDQLNVNRKESYLNFLLLLKKIIKYKNDFGRNKGGKKEFLNLLDNFSSIFAREWLRKVINRL